MQVNVPLSSTQSGKKKDILVEDSETFIDARLTAGENGGVVRGTRVELAAVAGPVAAVVGAIAGRHYESE